MREEAMIHNHCGGSPLLVEVQVGLFELASARDYLQEGGDSFSGIHRAEDAVQRIDEALRALRLQAMSLLLDLSAAEDDGNFSMETIRSRALDLGRVVAPFGPLDRLLDQLDEHKDIPCEALTMLRRSARADLLEVRMHLQEVRRNYRRICGINLSREPAPFC